MSSMVPYSAQPSMRDQLTQLAFNRLTPTDQISEDLGHTLVADVASKVVSGIGDTAAGMASTTAKMVETLSGHPQILNDYLQTSTRMHKVLVDIGEAVAQRIR